jgi:hypothetical protein
MRTEKFDNSKEAYNSDDIKYAFQCNGLAEKLDEIDVIVAEVCGANDEDSWFWILQMKDGTFAWAKGSCDYTGWDCQSSAEIHEGFTNPADAIMAVTVGDYDGKPEMQVKICLTAQVAEELPFAIYDSNYGKTNN